LTAPRARPRIARPDIPSIIEFVSDSQLLGLSISLAQRTLLKTIYGLPLGDDEHAIFRACTGRETYSTLPVSEVTVVAGARAGKDSRIAAPIVCYEALFGGHEYHLARGERGVIPLVAQDARAAKIAFGYIAQYLTGSRLLASLVDGDPLASEIVLRNGLSIVCFPCTLRSLRGFSIPVAIMDELAFYRLEGQADSDVEIQASIRRGMISFPNTKLVKISTPYMKSGVLHDDFKRAWGVDDPDLLVWRASSLYMNPALRAERLERHRRLDPSRFAREYEAEFTDDLEAFIARSWIEACVVVGRHALAPQLDRFWYSAAIDASGGGGDAFTVSVVHLEGEGPNSRIVQDYLKGFSKPRNGTVDLEGVVAEIVTVLRGFDCVSVLADRYAANWVVQAFARHGIAVTPAPDKSACYVELEPVIAQGRLALLDHPAQTRELSLLERRARPGGKPSIDHPRGGHDDHAASLALAVYAALQAAISVINTDITDDEYRAIRQMFAHPGDFTVPEDEYGGNVFDRFA
jgi:hypothetical protein